MAPKNSHKFELGQSVRLVKLGASDAKSSSNGLYKITRIMPEDQAGDVHYRLQSPAGERVASEGEIEAGTADISDRVFRL